MARYPGGGKNTVESCRSVDVLRWNKLGYLRSPRRFSWTWTRDGKQVTSINVETYRHSATLKYQNRSYGEDRRCRAAYRHRMDAVSFRWRATWFVCSVAANGGYCGREVTKLYGAGRLFACRHCYQLAYASQQESAHQRGLGKSQKIRMRLGGSPNMLEEFPNKPKGMHWRTYERQRRLHDAAEERSTIGLMGFVKRFGRRTPAAPEIERRHSEITPSPLLGRGQKSWLRRTFGS
jgi:hypothetical protein